MKLSLCNLLNVLVGPPQGRATRPNWTTRLHLEQLEERATPSALSPFPYTALTAGVSGHMSISRDQYTMH